jgi:hypothetical protein
LACAAANGETARAQKENRKKDTKICLVTIRLPNEM